MVASARTSSGERDDCGSRVQKEKRTKKSEANDVKGRWSSSSHSVSSSSSFALRDRE